MVAIKGKKAFYTDKVSYLENSLHFLTHHFSLSHLTAQHSV